MYVTNEVTYSVLIYVIYKQHIHYSLCDMCLLWIQGAIAWFWLSVQIVGQI